MTVTGIANPGHLLAILGARYNLVITQLVNTGGTSNRYHHRWRYFTYAVSCVVLAGKATATVSGNDSSA